MTAPTRDCVVTLVTAAGRANRMSGFAVTTAAAVVCASDVPMMALAAFDDQLNLFSLTESPGADGTDPASVTALTVLIQRGEGNLATVVSFGPVQAVISQFGQDNTVQLQQDGERLVSVVEQGRAPGVTSFFETELAQRATPVDPFGSVSGNDAVAFFSQAALRNGSILIQNDFAVRSNIVQTGMDGLSEARQWDQASGSIAQVFQAGTRSMSDIDQAGTELGSIVRKIAGAENTATVFQTGGPQVSEILQSGQANIASARQSGSAHRSTTSQVGTGNIATVDQSSRTVSP